MGTTPGPAGRDDDDLDARRIGRRLEYATVGWNVVEVAVAVSTGIAAGSLALLAFGLDSAVEVFASLVVIWHLGGADERADPARARRALRLIAAAFVVLAVYLVAHAGYALVTGARPSESALGTGFMGATVLAMFGLAAAKRRAGRRLGNSPLVANASMTFLDGCLATGILLALLANMVFGWWWTDAVAALAVAAIALFEGVTGWREAGEKADSDSTA
jgi:divalent metal cation (Fe/Co/Zn/Cd) transporter